MTLIQYDRNNQPTQIVFADRAEFDADKWVLYDSSVYHFDPDGSSLSEPRCRGRRSTSARIQPRSSSAQQRRPQSMSRSQIAGNRTSGQLTETEMRKYVTTYQEKLAQPFACFVFMLIAIPFGLRPARGGGGMGIGFGLSS